MKIFILLILLVSFPTFASTGISGFFNDSLTFFQDIWFFITDTIPETINSFFVWLYTYVVYLYFKIHFESLSFAHSVALSFLDMIDLTSIVNNATSALSPDLKQVAVDVRFFDSLTLLVEALITRLVYKW
ncbi:hypothetical protein [Colwellia sp. 20A7]|uniref:hypothetical protein n=1 Tax=Colwellia sp. 20A7 TaxID=2689569 RepID=UPI00135C0E47|nr:hypothetical protein [Colwellia sp. 20A7]